MKTIQQIAANTEKMRKAKMAQKDSFGGEEWLREYLRSDQIAREGARENLITGLYKASGLTRDILSGDDYVYHDDHAKDSVRFQRCSGNGGSQIERLSYDNIFNAITDNPADAFMLKVEADKKLKERDDGL